MALTAFRLMLVSAVAFVSVNGYAATDRYSQALRGSFQRFATEDHVKKIVEIPGDGKTFPKVGNRLMMTYTGKLGPIWETGAQFDSSIGRGIV